MYSNSCAETAERGSIQRCDVASKTVEESGELLLLLPLQSQVHPVLEEEDPAVVDVVVVVAGVVVVVILVIVVVAVGAT